MKKYYPCMLKTGKQQYKLSKKRLEQIPESVRFIRATCFLRPDLMFSNS